MISPARQLFKAYRFKDAVEAYRRQLHERPEDKWPNLDGLAESLLASDAYSEAIPYLEKMDEHYRESPGRPGCAEQLSVCHWMIGERSRALDIIKELVIGVRDGQINYTEISGGVPYGLILCYMAATLRLVSDLELALKYLTKLATRRRIQYWPGPAALFLLRRISFEDALKDATGSSNLPEAKKIAEQELMKRRHLTAILFAKGTERRMTGDETGCQTYMAECASLTNPVVEYEWHLAKSEVAASLLAPPSEVRNGSPLS